LWLKAGDHRCYDILLCKALDIANLGAITMFNQSNSHSIATSAPSTTDTVRVVFWFHWQAKVNYVTNAWNINTTCRYISRY
jgi:hypothetical protein